jgi:hypothetical protein
MPSSDGVPGGKHRRGTEQKTQDQEKKTKVDDKGYRSAIDRLPDEKFDPWRNTR